ncbi:Thiamine-phosphate synthase [Buchnera aphidicola (Neophyllaphis podocarpi)]|uniref:thiamine phosphate synthase n=1 Tax=Buchnera aphidicola TaxID=9 RepID=UPI0034649AB0
MYNFPRTIKNIGLYPIVHNIKWILRLIKVGVKIIQLRIKNKPIKKIKYIIYKATNICKFYKVKLFINDYWELAIEYKSYGVHLGQEDLLSSDLLYLCNSGLRIGISTHNYSEVNIAIKLNPSYIALGHIFKTKTKKMPSTPQGIYKLREHVNNIHTIPTVAIGGINIKNANSVLSTGVNGISVISAITKSSNWKKDTLNLLKLVNSKLTKV